MIPSKKTRLAALSAAGAAMLLATSCGESAADDGGDGSNDIETLIISGVPAEEATNLESTYDPVMAMLEDELGIEVEFQPSTDYAAVIEAQRNGQVHIAQYGAFSYYIATQSGSDITVLGAMQHENGVEPGYVSYGIVPAGSDITGIEDFAGKTLCFVDPNSTSGYLYPFAGLLEAGIEEGDWTEVMSGGHDASVIAVASGQCDAGFAFDTMVDETVIASGGIEAGDVEVVWRSETITSAPITVWNGLDADLRDQIMELWEEKANQDYLIANGYCEEGDCDLTDERIWGWTPVPDDFYDGLALVCEQTGAEACETG